MKPIKKTLTLLAILLFSGAIYAQSDLLAENSAYAPSHAASLFKSDDKITISEFLPDLSVNKPTVNVKCVTPLTVQVKVFNMNGNMAKHVTYDLDKGLNELNVNMDDLAEGIYMVQFYSKEGSAVRRFVKSN